jgi:osmotically inducible protein OsmC
MPMNRIAKVVYTARTGTTGGRENGASRSTDGVLDIRLSTPGSARIGTNPEQLFAAGWSASFASAIESIAYQGKIALPAKVRIDAKVNLNCGENGCFLSAQLDISVPGLKRGVIQALVDKAHEICPYSKATQGNIDVTTRIV